MEKTGREGVGSCFFLSEIRGVAPSVLDKRWSTLLLKNAFTPGVVQLLFAVPFYRYCFLEIDVYMRFVDIEMHVQS